jgi:Flp pilus assembly protein CpaB
LSQVDNPSVHFAPGDYVDIILPNRGKEGETEVDLLIKGVKIIAVDQYLQQGQSQGGKPLSTVPKTITVEVDTKQAELLAESIFDGHIILSQYSAFTPPKASEMGVSEAKKTPTNATITILRGAGDGKPQDGLSSILPLPPSPSPSPSLSNQGQRE